jgi:hypothetical protein
LLIGAPRNNIGWGKTFEPGAVYAFSIANSVPTTTTTTLKAVSTTINCYKGKLLKKVTAVKPVCPAGYLRK